MFNKQYMFLYDIHNKKINDFVYVIPGTSLTFKILKTVMCVIMCLSFCAILFLFRVCV